MSLLRVNRQVSVEGRDAFDVNTVLIRNKEDVIRHLDDLRQVELSGSILKGFAGLIAGVPPYEELKVFLRKPGLRSLTISRGVVARKFGGLRKYVEQNISTDIDVKCLRLGRFELRVPLQRTAKIYCQDFVLEATLPTARVFSKEFLRDGPDSALDGKYEAASSLPRVWLFALRLASFEMQRLLADDTEREETSAADGEWVEMWERGFENLLQTHASFTRQLPAGVHLSDLTVAEHGTILVEAASNMLSDALSEAMACVERVDRTLEEQGSDAAGAGPAAVERQDSPDSGDEVPKDDVSGASDLEGAKEEPEQPNYERSDELDREGVDESAEGG